MVLRNATTSIAKWISVLILLGMTGTVYAQHNMQLHQTPLTEAGNDIFGTIQEVIKKLEANPHTDWSKVNLEGLRQHLLDMKAFTEQVKITAQKPIEDGVEIHIRPTSERASHALKRLFSMHPAMLKKEKGWDMNAQQRNKGWIVTCTSDKKSDVTKIRALGYIGLIAEGAHHQLHHWMIATGQMDMNKPEN